MAQRRIPEESPKAKLAYAAYLAMGNDRSLAKLVAKWGRPESYVGQLQRWSSDYGWQNRLAEVGQQAKERAKDALAEAEILDALTFLATSHVLSDTIAYTTYHHPDVVVKVRESVRPKTSSTVEHKHIGEVRHTYDLSRLSDDELANLRALAEKYEHEGVPV